jgi:hypothetical protein
VLDIAGQDFQRNRLALRDELTGRLGGGCGIAGLAEWNRGDAVSCQDRIGLERIEPVASIAARGLDNRPYGLFVALEIVRRRGGTRHQRLEQFATPREMRKSADRLDLGFVMRHMRRAKHRFDRFRRTDP